MRSVSVLPCAKLGGCIDIPGDKSISHRALMFASIADGTSSIENLLEGHDCLATLQLMRSLGVHIELDNSKWLVHGRGRFGLLEPESVLDCKNSGTTIRLMAGLLAGMPFMSILDGTDQIKGRPMGRVIEPLQQMGARVYGRAKDTLAPLVILPSTLSGISYELANKSAQVKSAILLAGLFAQQKTRITNTRATRDHTEMLLKHMGADIAIGDDFVELTPSASELWPISIKVPGDISSAAFMIVAGLMRAEKGLLLQGVGVNATRTGIIDALKAMGASIELSNERIVANEPIADIFVKKSSLHGVRFSGDLIVRMIDEIPILALAATQAEGITIIEDAHELRVKETNRIQKTVECLKILGANIEESHDGMIIKGPTPLQGAQVSSFGDHRLALLLCVAGLVATKEVIVINAEVINDSYPGFLKSLNSLGASTVVIE